MSSKQKIRIDPSRDRGPKKPLGERVAAVLKPLAIILVVVLLIGGAFAVTRLGPKKVTRDEALAMQQVESPLVQEKRDEVAALIKTFDGIEDIREIAEGDLPILEEALAKQKEVVAMTQQGNQSDVADFERLDARCDTYRGKFIYEQSVEAEKEGQAALRAEERVQALEAYRRALRLQETIHEDYNAGGYVNHQRLVTLKHTIDEIELGPRYEESQRLEQYAEQAIKVRDWKAAKDYLDRSVAIQKDINQNYSSSRYRNVTRFSQLEGLRITVASGVQYDELIVLEKEGDEAMAAGDSRAAAAKYQDAKIKQSQLNSTYKQSRFATEEKLNMLEDKRQSALSAELADEIEVLDFDLTQALRDRDATLSVSKAVDLKRNLERMKENFPRSNRIREDLILKASFLNLRQNDIGFIQDRIYGQLLPLEGIAGLQMLKSEVSQVLYERIMGTNPSRNRNETLPADSMTWVEANEFCERLSWLMGLNVRLPNGEEFEVAVGDIRYAPLRDWTWNRQNSDRQTHPCAEKEPHRTGYHDLLGNVGEWLITRADGLGDGAVVMGGDASDTIEKLASIPTVERDIRERNRFTGFRFVVEMEGYAAPEAKADES